MWHILVRKTKNRRIPKSQRRKVEGKDWHRDIYKCGRRRWFRPLIIRVELENKPIKLWTKQFTVFLAKRLIWTIETSLGHNLSTCISPEWLLLSYTSILNTKVFLKVSEAKERPLHTRRFCNFMISRWYLCANRRLLSAWFLSRREIRCHFCK